MSENGELFRRIINELNDYIFTNHKLPSISDVADAAKISSGKCTELCDILEGQNQIYVISGGGHGKPKIIIPYDMMESILNTQSRPKWIEQEDYNFKEIKGLATKISEFSDQLNEYYKFQFLLYGTDVPLERNIAYALNYLEFNEVIHHEDNKNYADITFTHDELKYLIEVEGTTKQGDKSKVLQLDGWFKVEIENGASSNELRGIFFINSERNKSPEERGSPLTPHAIEFMKRYNFIFMTTSRLFSIVKDIHYNKIDKQKAREMIIKGINLERM
jgi:hypothetical protein